MKIQGSSEERGTAIQNYNPWATPNRFHSLQEDMLVLKSEQKKVPDKSPDNHSITQSAAFMPHPEIPHYISSLNPLHTQERKDIGKM
jgi:hypothetical protein